MFWEQFPFRIVDWVIRQSWLSNSGKSIRAHCSCNHGSWYIAAAPTFFSGNILSILWNSKLGISKMSAGPSCGRNSALSLHAPCWDGADGEAKQGMAVPLGRHGSGQILTQALVHAEAASDFHRKDGKRNKHCSRKTSCGPQRACDIRAVATLYQCGTCQLLQFPGTNWLKFSCLGNVQFLKLRVFLQ